jgi:anthranilate synthase component 1
VTDIDLSREAFVDHASGERPVVVRASASLEADVTPMSAYAALTGRTTDVAPPEYGYLLESAGKTPSSDPDGAFRAEEATDRHARYSFVGYDPVAAVTVERTDATVETLDPRYEDLIDPTGDDAVDTLRSALPDARLEGFPEDGRQHLDGGLVGFLAYDAVYDMWLDEVGREHPDSRFADAGFVLDTKTVVFDHADETVDLVFTPLLRAGEDAGAVYDGLVAETERVSELVGNAGQPDPGGVVRHDEWAGPREEYERSVERANEAVLDGEVYQCVVSRERRVEGEVDPLGLYAALREVNPSPYMYHLRYDDLHVVGASPETLVSVRDGTVMANPIAGTCPRGDSPVEDRRLAGEMLADEKERAEHTMLVDLARNDVRRVSNPGSVRVEEFMNVLKYSHVQHIESTVTAELAADADAFDATRAAFPAGTLAGAPKIRAMELIDDLEATPRGVYGGGVGYYSWTGDADFAIVIRTATVEHAPRDGLGGGDAPPDRITVRAGAGIVADSDPTAEFEETEKKMDGVLAAIDRITDDDRATGEASGSGEPVSGEISEDPEPTEVGR